MKLLNKDVIIEYGMWIDVSAWLLQLQLTALSYDAQKNNIICFNYAVPLNLDKTVALPTALQMNLT